MMKLRKAESDLYIPSGDEPESVFAGTTHLAIGAHQDDIEIFAYHGILECFQEAEKGFAAVIATNGAGSPRAGRYAAFDDARMKAIRLEEQRKAASLGEYRFVAQLGYPSREIKDPENADPVEDLTELLQATRPEVLYLHNPADKHDTHIAVLARSLEAVRRLPVASRPGRVLGCEVWRDLDWLPDALKVPLPVDGHPNLAAALLGVFDSQITGGKRYDLATEGRRLANATFFQSHVVDDCQRITFAMDLTELFHDEERSLESFVLELVSAFEKDVRERVRKATA